MTLLDHNLAHSTLINEPCLGQTVLVRWPAKRRAQRAGRSIDDCELVLVLELLSPRRALVEAWVQCDRQREPIVARQAIDIDLERDADLLHIDASTPVRLAITIECPEDAQEPTRLDRGRLLFAQSPLLRSAGFPAGSHDAPSLGSE
jgi:hypothetical protein